MTRRDALLSAIVTVVSLVVCLGAGELVLRLKNSPQNNYDIEMWRYAKELKYKSPDEALDFDHLRDRRAVLQTVEVRLNSKGLRGPEVEPVPEGGRRILLLGGSITLGWGVPEKETVSARLQRRFEADGGKVQVLNGGIGNYNAPRYVSRFFKELTDLKPNDIVVHYFLRDAEALPPGGGNWFLRHSQLAVTLWIAYHRLFDKQGEASLVDHYRAAYRPGAPGLAAAEAKLKELAGYAKANDIRLTMAMVPDVHNLVDYKLGFVHDQMRAFAAREGYAFVDLLPAMRDRPPEALWAMPGDPHPNGLGHELMADAMFPILDSKAKAAGG